MIRHLSLVATLALSLTAKGEECLTVQIERVDKRPSFGSAPAAPKAEMETVYYTPNMTATVTSKNVTLMNFDTMTSMGIDHERKTYHSMQLGKMMEMVGMAPNSQARKKAAKGAPVKLGSSEPKATGKKLNIAGIECTEYQVRIDNNGHEIMAAMMKGHKSAGPMIKTYSLQTRCVSATKPEAYFRLRKSQEEKFMKTLSPDTQEKIKALAASGESGDPSSMVNGLISYQGKGIGADFYKGFELQGSIMNKNEVDDPRIKEQMKNAETGSIRTVKSISTSCPPARLAQAPVGYTNQSMAFGGGAPGAKIDPDMFKKMREEAMKKQQKKE